MASAPFCKGWKNFWPGRIPGPVSAERTDTPAGVANASTRITLVAAFSSARWLFLLRLSRTCMRLWRSASTRGRFSGTSHSSAMSDSSQAGSRTMRRSVSTSLRSAVSAGSAPDALFEFERGDAAEGFNKRTEGFEVLIAGERSVAYEVFMHHADGAATLRTSCETAATRMREPAMSCCRLVSSRSRRCSEESTSSAARRGPAGV